MEIAIIAHDGMKADMVQFLNNNLRFLSKPEINIIATGTTGTKAEKLGLTITKYLSGPKGGDAQIAAMTAEGKIAGIIFFRDPLGKHPHEPDIQMLMRICDLYNVPLATNPATGSLIIEGLLED